MIVHQWETGLSEDAAAALDGDRALREDGSPMGQLLAQTVLDDAVRALQEDLALLQARQEQGITALGGALEQIGHELAEVRNQLAALAEPLLATQAGLAAGAAAAQSADERERLETGLRFERLEKQVALLMRGMDLVDSLRYQSDVHTRALARLTDLLSEVVKPKPIEGMDELQLAVASLRHAQLRACRSQMISMTLLGIGMAPGIGAFVWLFLRGFS